MYITCNMSILLITCIGNNFMRVKIGLLSDILEVIT